MDNDFYKILEIEKSATGNDIKKAYRRLAMQFHPDKAQTDKKIEYTDKFAKISEAYEVLSNPEKRSKYDMGGIAGLKNGFVFNKTPVNIVRKTEDTLFIINVPLKEVYTGCEKKLRITKNTILYKKTGKAVEIDNPETIATLCKKCNGRGFIMSQGIQIAPGIFQSAQIACMVCNNTGFIIKDEYTIGQFTDWLNLQIEPGNVIHGEQRRFKGRGNCVLGTMPGDIVIQLNIESSDGFELDGRDLIYNKEILLSEALCGGFMQIKLLNNETMYIKFDPIIKYNEHRIIKEKGIYAMSLKNEPKGDLIISFKIKMPDMAPEEKNRDILINILPKPNKIEIPYDATVYKMI